MAMKISELLAKNPFPRVAHAGSLEREVLYLTIKTKKFEETLKTISLRSDAAEPLAVIVIGDSGSGKTHLLRLLVTPEK